MLRLAFSGQFKRDYKLAVKRGCEMKKLETAVEFCAESSLCRKNIAIMYW